jgi:hypothetical protein
MKTILKQALEAAALATIAVALLCKFSTHPPLDVTTTFVVFPIAFVVSFMLAALWFKQRSEKL